MPPAPHVAAHYRPDIDGLRALAIVPVVLFHLGLPMFSGGFVGVDVFFVISGYLITSIIIREIRAGTFSFARFYERRVRRLAPALFAALAATSIAAITLMAPTDFLMFSRSLAATTLFAANLLFYLTAGYFDDRAEMKPLLHAWSLSVEEQFYICFPVLLLLLHRYLPRRLTLVVGVIGLASFSGSVLYVGRAQDAVFYLPVFRAWELLLGVVLALDVFPRVSSRWLRDVLAVFAIALIGYAVYAFSEDTIFPGANALLPTVGTALLIHLGGSGPSAVGRLLSVPWLVFLGLIAYPLYLWHWPVIVFTKYYLVRPLGWAESLAVIAVSVLLATLTWRYLERPFRSTHGLASRTTLFKVSGAVTGLFVVAASIGMLGRGLPGRFDTTVVQLAAVGAKLRRPPCYDTRPALPLMDQACRLGVDAPPTFLLWGDSHALALAAGVDAGARREGTAGLFLGRSGCSPLLGIQRYDRDGKGCRAFNDRVSQFLGEHPELKRVVLASRWALHSLGPAVISADGIEGNPKAFREGLERTLRFLHERRLETIFVTQVPEIGWNVPSVFARSAMFGRTVPAGPSLAAYRERQRIVDATLTELSARYPLRIVDVSGIMCAAGTCSVQRDGLLLYRDAHHLSTHGAMLLSSAFAGVLAGLNR